MHADGVVVAQAGRAGGGSGLAGGTFGGVKMAAGGADEAGVAAQGDRLTRAIERFEGTWGKRAGVLPSPQASVFLQGAVQAPPDVPTMTAQLAGMQAQPAAPSITPPTPVAAPDGRMPGFTNPMPGAPNPLGAGTLAYGGALAPGIGKQADGWLMDQHTDHSNNGGLLTGLAERLGGAPMKPRPLAAWQQPAAGGPAASSYGFASGLTVQQAYDRAADSPHTMTADVSELPGGGRAGGGARAMAGTAAKLAPEVLGCRVHGDRGVAQDPVGGHVGRELAGHGRSAEGRADRRQGDRPRRPHYAARGAAAHGGIAQTRRAHRGIAQPGLPTAGLPAMGSTRVVSGADTGLSKAGADEYAEGALHRKKPPHIDNREALNRLPRMPHLLGEQSLSNPPHKPHLTWADSPETATAATEKATTLVIGNLDKRSITGWYAHRARAQPTTSRYWSSTVDRAHTSALAVLTTSSRTTGAGCILPRAARRGHKERKGGWAAASGSIAESLCWSPSIRC